MDFTTYREPEDFLNDVSFRQWARGEKPEDDDYWRHWQMLNPDKVEAFNQALATIYLLKVESEYITETELEHHVEYIQTLTKPTHRLLQPVRVKWQVVAASVLLMLTLGGFFFYPWKSEKKQLVVNNNKPANSKSKLIEKVNTTDKPLALKLGDGSIVTLKKDSRISYLEQFESSKREVYLEGEAFFEVAKDAKRPFYVYANEVVTKVLGTSFNVKAYNFENNVLVTVKTGRVSVFAYSEMKSNQTEPKYQTKGVILTPNQQAEYSKELKTLNKGLILNPEQVVENLSVTPQHFIYQDVPLKQIFDQFEEVYGIDIIYDEKSISGCTLEADLSDEKTMYDKLNIICRMVGASYEIIEGQIVVSSAGCAF
jgi:ferric-dicitrate binding protein FerR (iron transport regulator)